MNGSICPACGIVHDSGETCVTEVDLRLGSTLDGKYLIVRLLGAGGMGRVYEARHTTIGRRVAIKFVLAEFAGHAEVLRRFETEARSAGQLEHENIGAVLDFGAAPDGARYLVMEFLEGEDCDKLLTREGPLPIPRALNIVVQACRGLVAAHRAGIVHRDLKPANLFLTRRGDRTDLVKILDFGIAKVTSEGATSATATGMAMGTAFYMSPEQARGDKSVDHRTDIYAVGVILYELLTGRKPHNGESYLQIIYSILNCPPPPVESIHPHLPAGLPQLIARAMNRDAALRPQSIGELGDELSRFLGGSIPPVRSQPQAPAVSGTEDTVASPRDSRELPVTPSRGAETVAPVTPKTRAPYDPGAARSTAVRRIALAALVGMLAVVSVGAIAVRLSRTSNETEAAAAGLVSSAVVAAPLASSVPVAVAAAPAAGAPGSEPSGQPADRPDASSAPAQTGARKGPAKIDGGGSPAVPMPPPSVSAAPASTAPPSHPPAGATVDIDREPNF